MRFRLWQALPLVSLVLASSAHAMEPPLPPPPPPPPENVLLADLGLHVIGVGVQHTVLPWLAGQIAVELYVPWTQERHVFDGSKATPIDVTGTALRGRLFFYPFRGSPSGLWISPFGQFGIAVSDQGARSAAGSVAALGASVGYSILLLHKVHIALGLGAQYHVAHFPGVEGPPSFATFAPTVDLNIGYPF